MACDCVKCLDLKGLVSGQAYFDELMKYIFVYSQLVIGNWCGMIHVPCVASNNGTPTINKLPRQMITKQATQRDFWNLPEVKEQQTIQQGSRFGDKAHKDAFDRMKSICSSQMGADFAESYFGEYE